jgi:hypothetical protein
MSDVYITFLTTIKICRGYEFLIERINLYILNIRYYCEKYGIPYEILICDNINEKNCCKIRDKIIDHTNVRVFDMEQTYPNPHGFNMIESYGKNLCLRHARGTFCCMTSADQMFSEKFFQLVKNGLAKEVFYRFATFEVPAIPVNVDTLTSELIPSILERCKHGKKRLCNPGMFDNLEIGAVHLGQKSGDIMMLDTESFRKIKGWPETDCFAHMDTVVCIVATNNFPYCIPPKDVCTYTFEQEGRSSTCNQTLENYQWNICKTYVSRKTCN